MSPEWPEMTWFRRAAWAVRNGLGLSTLIGLVVAWALCWSVGDVGEGVFFVVGFQALGWVTLVKFSVDQSIGRHAAKVAAYH